VVTDRAATYPIVLEELLPAPWIAPTGTPTTGSSRPWPAQVAAAADARPQAGPFRQVIIGGHGLVQNVRRGHYELAAEELASRRLAVAFDELAVAI
jgi:IS6 family transposase